MYRFFLSLRYLRSRPINWIGVAGIFVSVTALILIMSIMAGFLFESRKHLRGDLAEIVIQPFFEAPLRSTGELPRRDIDGILEELRADPRVAGAAAQYLWAGMLAPPGRESMLANPLMRDLTLVSFVGIDPTDQYTVSDLREHLELGAASGRDEDLRPEDLEDPFAPPANYVPDGRPLDGVILGEQLAYNWQLRPGSTLTLVTGAVTPNPETGQGEIQEAAKRDFVVAGTFRSQSNELDLQRVYLSRAALSDWLGKPGSYTQVAVKLHDYDENKDAFTRETRARLHELGYLHRPARSEDDIARFPWEIETWEDQRSTMLAAIENEKTLLGIMLSLVLVVAGFTIFAILSMLVTEKRRDIGILAALGATPNGILSMFVLIAGWEALFGTLLGVAAGIVLALNINSIERSLSDLFGIQIFNRDIYLFDHIPTVIEQPSVMLIAFGAILLSFVAAAVPAIRAARLDPVDALRYE